MVRNIEKLVCLFKWRLVGLIFVLEKTNDLLVEIFFKYFYK